MVNYLAVPLRKAFEWWGYGRLDKPAASVVAAKTDEAGPQEARSGPLTWKACCAQRRELERLGLRARQAAWTDEQCVALATEFARLEGVKGARKPGALTTRLQIADDLGIAPQSFKSPLDKGRLLLKEREEEQARAEEDRVRRLRSAFGD